jgi:hypothetical protein
MNETYATADLVLCKPDGEKTSISIEPGQLAVVFRVLGLDTDTESEEDEDYSPEMEAEDPYWTREMQAEIHRARRAMRAGETIKFDPLREPIEVAEARLKAHREARRNG